jgi:transcriptional regulator with XRE-family HTH domain
MRIPLKRDRLLALIAASNLSQNHWAMKLGLSRGHWSNIVSGKHPYPSARTCQLLVEAFGVPADELFAVEAGAPPSDPPFHAAVAGRFLIDREVGQGGMGTVYLARDIRLGRVVAIKVISPEAVSGIGPAIQVPAPARPPPSPPCCLAGRFIHPAVPWEGRLKFLFRPDESGWGAPDIRTSRPK